MFSPCHLLCSFAIILLFNSQICLSELTLTSSLVVYSPGEPEYLDVLVRQVNDNLTLVCELRGDLTHTNYVWNYVPTNQTHDQRPLQINPVGSGLSSTLQRTALQVTDSGHYMCSVPPHSVTKYIAVQTKGAIQCARGAFACDRRCVLPAYVCDGFKDCEAGEDEASHMCLPRVCARPEKLNCSSGRCISSLACCRGATPLCHHPSCCDEYIRDLPLDGGGIMESEYPALYEDHRAPDDYGFIQSTIYTVTACALIFMIAVVLLVSAICKMQMKRAALRGYTHADRATRHYAVAYHQAHSFPPCYEASRLMEDGGAVSPARSPTHQTIDNEQQRACVPEPAVVSPPRGLARLTNIFSSRYRQVPTLPDVELTSVPPSSTPTSPSHSPPLPLDYRSPTYCELNADLIFTHEDMGRELNYMATPVEFFRRRTMRRNTLERVMDQLDRQRMTLQLGRFQLSIPRLGRTEPRPDTPVAESRAAIDSLDLLRIDARDTYTLNGRTIRLLGADIQHPNHPPSYTDATRYKLYGPPPEYLSREGLNRQSTDVDQDATTNVEMPPRYDDLTADVNGNGNSGTSGDIGVSGVNGDIGVSGVSGDSGVVSGNTAVNSNAEVACGINSSNGVVGGDTNSTFNSEINSLNRGNNNEVDSSYGVNSCGINNNVTSDNGRNHNNDTVCVSGVNCINYIPGVSGANGDNEQNAIVGVHSSGVKSDIKNKEFNGNTRPCRVNENSAGTNNSENKNVVNINSENMVNTDHSVIDNANGNGNVPNLNFEASNPNLETLSSIIDNLPAIDSDVNANDDVIREPVNVNVN